MSNVDFCDVIGSPTVHFVLRGQEGAHLCPFFVNHPQVSLVHKGFLYTERQNIWSQNVNLLLPLSLEIRRETAEIWHGAPLTPYRLDTKGIFHLQFRGAEKNGHEFLQLMLLKIEAKSYFCHCH